MDADRVLKRDSMRVTQRALGARYDLIKELSVGGTATVYLAEESTSGARYAVKVLDREYARMVATQRFLREIDFAARLNHPHIVGLTAANQVGDVLFYVMPYIEGESLAEKIKRESQLALDEVLLIATQVASALGYAHAKDIVHRDIKPGNILLRDDHAFVTDFGVALALCKAEAERITSSGFFVGTPVYMSPEQSADCNPIDGRADIYALGCVMYEMLIGEPVFDGPDAQVIVARHRYQRIPSLQRRREDIPSELDTLVQTCLAKSPEDRFSNAWELQKALEDVAERLGADTVRGDTPNIDRRPRLV